MGRMTETRWDQRHERPHAHVVGLSGQGMAGLAQSLAQSGMSVTGSWPVSEPDACRLRQSGVSIRGGEANSVMPRRTQLLVHGPGVTREHPNRLVAIRRRLAQAGYAEYVRGVTVGRQPLVFLGGRQASVAAAMTGWVLARSGADPSVLLSLSCPQLGGSARVGLGRQVVVDWPDGLSGLQELGPFVTVFLPADPAAESAAETLCGVRRRSAATPPGATVLTTVGLTVCGEDEPITATPLSLGGCEGWWGADVRDAAGGARFRVFEGAEFVTEIGLAVPGRRHVISALAAVAACRTVGVAASGIRQGLEEFGGLARDFESRGSFRGVTLIDDASDDAASIGRAVFQARRQFGTRRLWALYGGPAQADPDADTEERRRVASALAEADRVVLVAGVPGAAADLAAMLRASGPPLWVVDGREAAVADLDRKLEPGDVLLTLGAGDVGTIADAFIRRLPRDRPGR